MFVADSSDQAGLAAKHLCVRFGDAVVIEGLDLAIPDKKVSVIVGPNACGKSTLLKALSRLLPASGGSVLLDGKSIHSLPTKQVAKRLGMLPQSPICPEGITVADLVARGRTPHQGVFRQWSHADDEAVRLALIATSTLELAQRNVDELSGGQRQRVWIAMAIAQETPLLLLDEPTTFLDIAHQVEVLDLLRRLNQEQDRTVVAVLHDLNLAARYADHMVAIKSGEVVTAGAPEEVVTTENVEVVFGLRSQVITDPVSGTPLVIPLQH